MRLLSTSTRLLFLALFGVSLTGHAQITIDRTDMPNVGDTLRISNGIPDPTLDLLTTGANQTWDFSQLVPTSQTVRGFQSVASTGGLFPIIFGFGTNQATIATKVQLPLDSLPGGGITLGDIFGFFKETGADFRQVGYGASFNGLPVPVTFRSAAQQDVFYRFPLTFGTQDSSRSSFEVNVPGTAYLAQDQNRVNNCDGWGTLTTPFGTFPTIRVVTRLDTYDSLALTGQTPIALQIPTRHEYKWIGKNQGIPLLTITTTALGGQEAITAVEYRDIPRRITLGTRAEAAALGAIGLSPNPAASGAAIRLHNLPTGPVTVTVSDALGRVVAQRTVTGPEARLSPADLVTAHGVLTVRLQTSKGTAVRRLVRE